MRYNHKNDIDLVIDMLLEKGENVFFSIKDDKLTLIDEGKLKIRMIEIFNKNTQIDYENRFDEEISVLKKIKSIDRALYLYLYPNCEFPMHIDSDDNYYRIITGVIINDNVEVQVLEKTINIDKKQSIGFQASRVPHRVINYSSKPNTIIVLCLNYNYFETDYLIEVNQDEIL